MKKLFTLLLLSIALGAAAQADQKLNILFIAVDDLNDWVGFLGGYEGNVHTPNLDRLAQQSTTFANAQCPSPICGPSRAAILSGQLPSTTGIYYNDQWLKPNLPEIKTIPSYFKENGYYVAGAGKIFHHTAGFNPPDQWHEYFDQVFDDSWNHAEYYDTAQKPAWFPLNGIDRQQYPKMADAFDWGVWQNTSVPMGDQQAVDWAKGFLKKKRENPFFLAVGLYHPHIPWYAPQEYFDLYPLEKVVLPTVLPADLEDIPEGGEKIAAHRRHELQAIVNENKYKEAVQAYLASISYADALVGQLLDAFSQSRYAENTIIVLWSDHGWHLGEKEHLHKSTLWEEAARVPFLIKVPGQNPSWVETPVNLVDVYPTLLSLSGLPSNPSNDGQDLSTLLQGKSVNRKYSQTTFGKGNHSIRDERYRYIRYASEGEELYDQQLDPYGYHNLVREEKYSALTLEMRRLLPIIEAEPVPRKGAFDFDPETYTWKKK